MEGVWWIMRFGNLVIFPLAPEICRLGPRDGVRFLKPSFAFEVRIRFIEYNSGFGVSDIGLF